MSEDTYYTVLGVPESAAQDGIKRAYRQLIRQVHPDHVPNASPYWRQAAEEKSKEINAAYRVLIDPKQRRIYDEQLAAYRQKSRPGTSAWPPEVDVTPPIRSNNNRPPNHQKGSPKSGYNWQPLIHWASNYPFLAGCLIVVMLLPEISFLGDLRQHKAATAAGNASASNGFYSAFPCLDPRDAVSPIDGKPCRKLERTSSGPEAVVAKPPIRLTTPRWFYVTSKGVQALGGVPDDDTCNRIHAKNSSSCEVSLMFCPRGIWSKECISYSKWKKSRVDPPREEKLVPVWPSQ
jgi:curved DNA-binding protein CbpA